MAVRIEISWSEAVPNGAAMAAVLGAGIGTFLLGLFVMGSELGVYSAPSLYAPAGGLSGRTTLGVVGWLVAWAILHVRWKNRLVAPRPVLVWTVVLTLLGVVAMYPPLWGLLR